MRFLAQDGFLGIRIVIPRDRSCLCFREWFACGLEPQKPSSGHAPAGLSSNENKTAESGMDRIVDLIMQKI